LVAGAGSEAIPAAVGTTIPTSPAVVLAFDGGVEAWGAGGSKVSKLFGEGAAVGQGGDEFFRGVGQGFGERGIGLGEIGHGCAIGSCGCCEVRDDVDGAALGASVIFRMKTGGPGGATSRASLYLV
jgi:hypothetical protein